MKFISFSIFIALANTCSSNKTFPSTMPADFKIEYHLDGGMMNMYSSITLQKGDCSEEGRKNDGVDYEYIWKTEDNKRRLEDLENLYLELKKLNAFTLRSKDEGRVYDRGGESIRYRINGKDYKVSNSQSNFIYKEDADAFNKSIQLIFAYSKSHRIKKTYSMNDFPETMPDDFTIEYRGLTTENRTVYLTKGNCIDQGNIQNTPFNYSWINSSLPDFKNLYVELRKLNAFGLEMEETISKESRPEQLIIYNINNKYYSIGNTRSYSVIEKEQVAFQKSLELIFHFSKVFSRVENK